MDDVTSGPTKVGGNDARGGHVGGNPLLCLGRKAPCKGQVSKGRPKGSPTYVAQIAFSSQDKGRMNLTSPVAQETGPLTGRHARPLQPWPDGHFQGAAGQ